jgi:(1->4)-alpha-D-glucan 1-alpha-D-glucosylmutase
MARIPVATYRLQLHSQFGFEEAAEVADYLEQLGISHVYCSPYLQAAPGSQHGYDVVDHHKVNTELGGAEAHGRFCLRLGECHLGQVLDVVPNHMAISGRLNRYWWDVQENGPSSRYSPYFDIDWQTREEKLRNKLLVPILGDHYGHALEKGDIQLKRKGADFTITYADHELPASPRSLVPVLAEAARETGSDYLAFLADSLRRLPSPTRTDAESVRERHRDKHVISDLLTRLFEQTPFIGEAVDHVIRMLNKRPDQLDALLEDQNYRLAFWQTSSQELPYRRFFDVNTLVGLRMESPQVFSDTHALILRWLKEGVLDGIRIDHPDGLRDPKRYFERLRAEAPDVWIVGEKILEPGEALRTDWPVDGTTGYDFLNECGGLFIDSAREDAMNQVYTSFTGESVNYSAVCREKKHLVLRDLLGSDVNRLTSLLSDIFENHREQRDYTRLDARRAIRELVACFSVYRTYIVPEKGEITPDDERYVNQAVEAAKANRPEIDPDLLDFIRDILLLRVPGEQESEFVMRFQQFTSPVMAKGVEDTVFYCFNRMLALNEVGGDPGRYGVSPESFHAFNQRTQAHHPASMLASSTHDTKRSEDVRARLSLLSEIPEEWGAAVSDWTARNDSYKKDGFPDKNTEYLIYQTMVGAWPIEKERLLPYLEKAMREAKRNTSWLAPNEAFESAANAFVESLYNDAEFIKSLEAFTGKLIEPGRINSLAATLLKMTSPGIPDLYQGTELWNLSLVDPDNRRKVDYAERRKLLSELAGLCPKAILQRADEGLPKLWTIQQALCARREKPESFGANGTYMPLYATGEKKDHLVSFGRGQGVVVAVPRLGMTRGEWGDTALEIGPGAWDNVLAKTRLQGGNIPVRDLFGSFPVALLIQR